MTIQSACPIHSICQSLADSLCRSLLIALSIAYLLGQVSVVWGYFGSSPADGLWWVVGILFGILGCIGLFLSSLGRRLYSRLVGLTACLVLAFCLGNLALVRVLDPPLPPEHLRQLSLPQKVHVEGWLYREPERLPHRARLYLAVTKRWQAGVPVPATGKILLTVRFLSGAWQYGDIVRLAVRLRVPRNFHTPGSFDYVGYLARRDIFLSAFVWDDDEIAKIGTHSGSLRSWLEHTRRTIGIFFDSQLDSHTAAILRALIIGDASGISQELRDTFARAGVAHVLAISGLHIGLVAAAAYGAWWWLLGRSQTILLVYSMPQLAALLTMPPVLLYAGLAGGRVSTWRAVITVFVYLLSIVLGRQHEVYRSLALAALLISIIWPRAVLEVSFQLSFVSILMIFVGLARFRIWWERLSDRLLLQLRPQRARLLRWGATYLVVSGCAIIATAPITAAHFNQIAIAGLFANLFVVPLLGSAAVILGLAAAGLLFVHAGLASLIVFGARIIIHVATWLVEEMSAWSYASFRVVTPTFFELVLVYGLLLYLLLRFFPSRQSPHAAPQPTSLSHPLSPLRYILPALLFLLLADCTYWTWQRFFRQDMRVTFLDIGQGDAAVVEFPGSHVMVIDGGGFASRTFDSGQAIIAPFLWDRKIGHIDTLVMSHPQLDHYGGLAFLAKHFRPREFWFNGEETDSQRFKELKHTLQQAETSIRMLCRDSSLVDQAGVHIAILHPPCQAVGLDTNNASLILRLSHGEIDFLFSGDVEAAGERVLLAADKSISSEILKVPHHGSRTSSTPEFITAVSAEVAVASMGFHNRFRFPAPEVVQRYRAQGGEVLRTDQAGAVTVVSDGMKYTLSKTRPLSGSAQ